MQTSASVHTMVYSIATRFISGLLGLAILGFAFSAEAETIRVVALGASNISGYAVGGTSGAWPARMEAILRAKGYDVTVSNQGVTGDTSSGRNPPMRWNKSATCLCFTRNCVA